MYMLHLSTLNILIMCIYLRIKSSLNFNKHLITENNHIFLILININHYTEIKVKRWHSNDSISVSHLLNI